jgi:hypothetical protein
MSLRQNVRNFLLPLTIAEVEKELEISIERGDARRAEYVREFLNELYEDFAGSVDDDEWADGDDCLNVRGIF